MQPRRFSCTTEADLACAGQLQAPKARLACRTGVLAGELRLQSVPMATMVELRGLESPTFSLQRLLPVPTDVLQCSDSAESRCMRTMIMTASGHTGSRPFCGARRWAELHRTKSGCAASSTDPLTTAACLAGAPIRSKPGKLERRAGGRLSLTGRGGCDRCTGSSCGDCRGS